MRTFPRAARRRMIAATSVAALALGTAVPLATADDLKDRQRRAEREVEQAEVSLDESSARLRRAQGRLDAVQERLGQAQAAVATAQGRVAVAEERDAEMQLALQEAEGRLDAAEAELESGREDLAGQQDVVVDTITSYYQQGDPELEAFAAIVGADSPEELTRQTELRDTIVDRESAAFDALRAAEVLLEVRRRQVAEARDEVEAQREAAAANLAEQEQAEAEAEAARADVRVLVGDAATARGAASRARATDERMLQQAQAEADQISEMLQRRAAAALRRQQASSAPAPAPSSGGALGWPTGGPVTSPYGMREHPIYGYYGLHDGVDFAPGCGAALVATAPGRVVSSYTSDVYGQRLVIDHGAVDGVGLATIYNHASSYTVGVGAQVERGQTIGYVGDTGWSTGCHLHFTVMANGQSVPPFNWIG